MLAAAEQQQQLLAAVYKWQQQVFPVGRSVCGVPGHCKLLSRAWIAVAARKLCLCTDVPAESQHFQRSFVTMKAAADLVLQMLLQVKHASDSMLNLVCIDSCWSSCKPIS